MQQSLSIEQIAVYDAIIQEQGVEGAKTVYSNLLEQGYQYAGWAGGVASGNSITGQSALGYLQGTALMGIGSGACQDLTPSHTDAIRVDMARAYLATLTSIAKRSGGFIDQDIKFKELSAFHKDVFLKHHLSIDNWTLHTPMELLRQAKGDDAVEALWVRLRDTGGTGIDALLASTALANQVGRMAFSSDPQLSEQARAWLDQTPGFANFAQMERMIDVLARTLGVTIDELATSLGNWSKPISEAVNQFFIASLTNPPAPRDPLVLDLDGDGIEAVPINPASPTLFDHNADGTRTATGWVKPDDGFVVLDLDGNGTIDSGRELFGDNTLLSSGQLARNGFEAIAQHDANGDGHIDAADAVFAQLQVWRDLNADGISQQGELSTLTDAGIASINVAGTASNLNLGGGNVQAFSGSFTRTDGAEGASGVANLSGSLLFAANNFYREFTDDPRLTDAARAQPQVHGSGWVRDLREAMSLGTPQAEALQEAVAAFAASDSHEAQRGDLLERVIAAWAETSDQMRQGGSSAGNDLLHHTLVLEVFNGARFPQLRAPEATSGNTIPVIDGDAAGGIEFMSITAWQISQLTQAWEALAASVYGALVVQTRLSPYLDSIALVIDEAGLRLDTSDLDSLVQTRFAADPYNGVVDLLELKKYAGATLAAAGWEPYQAMGNHLRSAVMTPELQSLLDLEQIAFMANGVTHAVANAAGGTLLGNDLANTIVGGVGVDHLHGGAGADALTTAGNGDDLYGEDGNDTLIADGGSGARLNGGAGDDTLRAQNTSGPTTFVGGTGNDTIIDGRGYNDIYLYNLGDGQDAILDAGARDYADTMKFGAGISPADLSTTRVGMNLVISHSNGQDKITVLDWFAYSDKSRQIERFEFTDGTVWTADQITTSLLIQHGMAEADTMTGVAAFADILYGEDGDDTLSTAGAGDKLFGGDGNDTLIADGGSGARLDGGAGDDILRAQNTSGPTTFVGGTGNDTIVDSRGYNDTYLYNLGDGQDTLSDAGARFYADTMKFGAGISPADLSTARVGMNLVISHSNGQDKITVIDWFAYSDMSRQIERFEFADGTAWTADQITTAALTVRGTDGADTMAGVAAFADILHGEAGDDTLTTAGSGDKLCGGDGNDTLIADGGSGAWLDGGAGDDILRAQDTGGPTTFVGGTGNDTIIDARGYNDTYLYNLGDGQDTITDAGARFYADTMKFGAGIAAADMSTTRVGMNLVISHSNGQDKITILDWFAYSDMSRQIERFEFADGTAWTADQITTAALTVRGTDGADTMAGVAAFADILHGEAGDDTLTTAGSGDKLYGGDGNDTLVANGGSGAWLDGGAGDDLLRAQDTGGPTTFVGGTGNDTTVDARGYNDTYLYDLGDGQDTITDAGARFYADTMKFGAGISPADLSTARVGMNLVISHSNGHDKITILDWFAYSDMSRQIERFEFADGTVWTADQLTTATLTVHGTDGADTMTGVAAFADILHGEDGDDTLTTAGAGDKLYGGDGNDILIANGGSGAWLDGGAGDDLLRAQDTGGPTTFVGGPGNDTIIDARGYNDTYLYNLGDGQDTITDAGARFYADTMKFGAGISPADLSTARVGMNLVISHINGQDKITVIDWFAYSDMSRQIERFEFADGTVWTADQLTTATLTVHGTDGADTMTGVAAFADILHGEDGDDTLTTAGAGDKLYGGDGNDILIANGGSGARLDGGAGDDLLRAHDTGGPTTFVGGTGNDTTVDARGYNDTYLYNLGDGQDTITDAGARFYADTMKFGAGIAAADMSTTRVGMNLVINHSNGQDKITVIDWFAYSDMSRQIERFEFADGTVWTADQLTTAALTAHGTAGADTMTGVAAFADILYGEDGNDTLTTAGSGDKLYGGDGNDTLIADGGSGARLDGGAGDDTLRAQSTSGPTTFVGGTGNDTITDARGYNDTYIYNLGDGQDTIAEAGAREYADTIKFGAGIAPADLSTTRVGMDLVISHCNGQDQITVLNWFAYSDMSRQIERFEFADGTVWTANQITTALMIQHGTSEADTMVGLAAFADNLYGDGGDDTLTTGGSGDKLYGEDGNDTLTADGGSGARLEGGAGDDTLRAQNTNGPTTFVGGTGNDTITDARGYNDTYIYNLGDGQDTIAEAGAREYADTIKFGAGIAPADLSTTRLGMDLVISHCNGQDQITVLDWFAYSDMSRQIERFEFADGTVWTSVQVHARALNVNGTSGNDTLNGTSLHADTLNGLDGDDTLDGKAGTDTLVGGTGNDLLLGGAGNDQLIGEDGQDTLDGGDGNDFLVGGAGTDYLTGGAGNDTYLWSIGQGNDTISEQGNWPTAGEADRLVLDALHPWDLSFSSDPEGNLLIQALATGETLRIERGLATGQEYMCIEQFEFAGGTTWNMADVQATIAAGGLTSMPLVPAGADLAQGDWLLAG